MTYQQPPLPPPPDGYANWLDAIVDGTWHARDELAALRKELSDTKRHLDYVESFAKAEGIKHIDRLRELNDTQGLLATAQQNLLEVDAQRAEAVREVEEAEEVMHEACNERDKAKALLVRCVNDGTDGGADEDVSLEFLAHAPAECAAIKQQRDALRAQVAEMREAALALGELEDGFFEYSDEIRLPWNAHVAKLRAEPAGQDGAK